MKATDLIRCLAILVLATAPAAAQDGGEEEENFDLDWNTIDCGGGEAGGVDEELLDDWSLEGTIGQVDAGLMEGGEGEGGMAGKGEDGDVFTLQGGFWPGATTEPACPTDLSGDGSTGVEDLVQVIMSWGQSGVAADINQDGTVNVSDMVAVITAWGPC